LPKAPSHPDSEEHIGRVRRICARFPETTEKLSHGEPTFFVRKKAFAMISNNHHNDGHLAVWIPAAAGVQEMLVSTFPDKYYRPPYVGVKGWVAIELPSVTNEELATRLLDAWTLIAPPKIRVVSERRA
jgi:hypothetical protein